MTRARLLPLLDMLVTDQKYVVRQHLSGQLLDMAHFFVCDVEEEEGYSLLLIRILPLFKRLVKDAKEEVQQGRCRSTNNTVARLGELSFLFPSLLTLDPCLPRPFH